MAPKPDFSVIIVNFNARDYLTGCLESLFQTTRESAIEVFVVDNGSTDGSCDLVKRRFPDVRLICNTVNRGFSGANNQAIKLARSDLVLLLNNDTMVLPGSIDTMVRLMRERDDVGVVGCTLRNADMSIQISFGRMINIHNEILLKLVMDRYRKGNRLIQRYLEWRGHKESHPDWVSGACLMARREALDKVGLMDENFFMYTEEVDLCHRIRQLGYSVLYTPKAEIIHFGGRSTETNIAKTVIEYRRSQLYFYKKHYGSFWMNVIRRYLLAKIRILGWRQRIRGADKVDRALLREMRQVVRSYR